MKKFELEIINNHPIIHENSNTILIDTGSPITIHKFNNLDFISKQFDVKSEYSGLDVGKISQDVGIEIDTLLGMDIMGQYKIVFDYKNKTFIISEKDIDFEGEELDISALFNIPIIKLQIKDMELNFFMDSGAKLSYIPQSIANDYKALGLEADFYPGLGIFETTVYKIPTKLQKNDFTVKYGILPEELKEFLMGTDGIIGYDFFNNFTIMLDSQRSKIKYRK